MKQVVIPQSDIDSLEKARIKLWAKYSNDDLLPKFVPIEITTPMWTLTNRKYPEVRLKNLPRIFWECLKREVTR